jgi:hypothetical protein
LQHSYFVEGSQSLADPKFEGLIGMWGRLAPGVSRSSAEQEMLSLTNQLRKIYPTVIWDHEYIVITLGAHFLSFEGGPPVLALVGLLVFLILRGGKERRLRCGRASARAATAAIAKWSTA